MSTLNIITRKSRSSSLSIKLDVIVEEDSNVTSALAIRPQLSSRPSQQSIISSVTHSLTICNDYESNSNDPQFLHTGRWPTLDMVDDILNAENRPIPQIAINGEIWDSFSDTVHDIDTWELITANQLTMVMDYWHPNKRTYPFVDVPSSADGQTTSSNIIASQPMITAQRSLFLREVLDEHLTRAQTVAHLEELEDNDNAVEIVATLEGFRQNGWSEEMVKAFPRECWFFWEKNVMASSMNLGHSDGCSHMDKD